MKLNTFLDTWVLEPLVKCSSNQSLSSLKVGLENVWPYLALVAFLILSPQLGLNTTALIPLSIQCLPFVILLSVSLELSKQEQLNPILILSSSSLVLIKLLNAPLSLVSLTLAWLIPLFSTLVFKWGPIQFSHLFKDSLIPQRVIDAISTWLLLALWTFAVLALPNLSLSHGINLLFELIFKGSSTLYFFIVMNTLNTWIWYRGNHGTQVLSIFVIPLATFGLIMNLQAYALNQTMPYVLTGLIHSVFGNYVIFNAIQFWMRVAPRNQAEKDLSKHSWLSSFFNINESLIFSYPLVHNTKNFFMFISINAINMSLFFSALHFKWIQPFFISLPFSIPSLFQSGLAMMNLNGSLLWLGLWLLDIVLMIPWIFIHKTETNV